MSERRISTSDFQAIAEREDFGTPTAVRRGRDSRWPFVPVVRHETDRRAWNEQILGRAFETHAEAVAYAEAVIAQRRRRLVVDLAEPRHRALREAYGLPRDLDQTIEP